MVLASWPLEQLPYIGGCGSKVNSRVKATSFGITIATRVTFRMECSQGSGNLGSILAPTWASSYLTGLKEKAPSKANQQGYPVCGRTAASLNLIDYFK